MSTLCERVNTYEVLEHIMGIRGLHPHRLSTIRDMRFKLAQHVSNNNLLAEGVVLDIGCGSGAGTCELATQLSNGQRVIGLDINSQALDSARKMYGALPNLNFYHGDINAFLQDNPGIKIAGVICISVTMFIQNLGSFYKNIYHSLMDAGMFIDAPFMFRDSNFLVPDDFCSRTYGVCGCNMQMFKLPELNKLLNDAGFSKTDCVEHDFDLMKLKILFKDYPAKYLLGNFFRNVMSPPSYLGSITSRYLARRTLSIFLFFLRNRNKYASGEISAIK